MHDLFTRKVTQISKKKAVNFFYKTNFERKFKLDFTQPVGSEK